MIFTPSRRYSILIIYFLFICFLFFLPGDAFPQGGNWMDAIQFDKWVHLGIFTILCFLICWVIKANQTKTLLLIFFTAVLYGLSVEIIQDQFIVNRSLDFGDWAADTTGSMLGTWFWRWRYIKK